MPCIRVQSDVCMSPAQKENLKGRFGEAISILPGKSERWLMVILEDQKNIWLQGRNDSPAAFLEVSLYGKADSQAYGRLTGELTRIVTEELQISPDRIYVKYEETPHWGWNGSNF